MIIIVIVSIIIIMLIIIPIMIILAIIIIIMVLYCHHQCYYYVLVWLSLLWYTQVIVLVYHVHWFVACAMSTFISHHLTSYHIISYHIISYHIPNAQCAANLRTKILDFRGFGSSIISTWRGGILMSMGGFPEIMSQQSLVWRILVGRLGARGTLRPPAFCRPGYDGEGSGRWVFCLLFGGDRAL